MTNSYPKKMENSPSIKNLLQIVFRQQKIIILFFVVVVALAVFRAYTTPNTYEATAKLLLQKEVDAEKAVLFRMNFPENNAPGNWIISEIEIIKCNSIASQVVKAFGLHQLDYIGVDLSEGDKQKILERTINNFRHTLNIRNLRNTNVVEISYESKHPELAAQIVNKVVEIYTSHRYKLSNELSTFDFFEKQLQVAEKKLQDLEQQQSQYKQKNEVISPTIQREILVTRLADYEKSLTTLRTKRISKEIKIAQITSQLKNGDEINFPSTESSDKPGREKYISKLKEELLTMNLLRQKLLQKFTNQYEKVISLDKQIAATKLIMEKEFKQILELEKATIRIIKAEEDQYNEVISQIKKKMIDLAQKEYEFTQISRGLEDNREIYSMLLKQREEARMSLAKQQRGIIINLINRATTPLDPIKPRKKVAILIALFLGLTGGLGIALIIDYFDHSINNPADIDKYTGCFVLGSVNESEALSSIVRSKEIKDH